MLPRKINPSETHKTSARGKCTVDSIGNGATVDCRKCTLFVKGHIGDNVTIISVGMPKYETLGNNVTFHICDAYGHCFKTRKLDSQGRDLPVSSSDIPSSVRNSRSCVLL